MKNKALYLRIEELETIVTYKSGNTAAGIAAGGAVAIALWGLFFGAGRLAIAIT